MYVSKVMLYQSRQNKLARRLFKWKSIHHTLKMSSKRKTIIDLDEISYHPPGRPKKVTDIKYAIELVSCGAFLGPESRHGSFEKYEKFRVPMNNFCFCFYAKYCNANFVAT